MVGLVSRVVKLLLDVPRQGYAALRALTCLHKDRRREVREEDGRLCLVCNQCGDVVVALRRDEDDLM